jgi:hypothetical protein
MFALKKWYFDVVGPGGRSAIGYSTELRWGPVALCWEGLSLHQPGEPPVHRWGVGPASPPTWQESEAREMPGRLEWRSDRLGCCFDCAPWTAPFARRLHESDDGTVDWACEAPAATVTAEPFGIVGPGYAECLTLTAVPWGLPISELRWGHWAGEHSGRSLVWIEWRGAHPLTLVLEDGAAVPGAEVADSSIRAGASELVLSSTVDLHQRTIGEVLEGLGPLAAGLPASWRAVEDRKRLSVGRLGSEAGWAVHETVRFP